MHIAKTEPIAVLPPLAAEEESQSGAYGSALWVHPALPESSLVITTDEARCFVVFDLKATADSRVEAATPASIDIRQNLVDVYACGSLQVRVYEINLATRSLELLTWQGEPPVLDVDQLSLGSSRDNLHAYLISENGALEQWA